MASFEQCRAAVENLAERLREIDPQTRARHVVDRTMSCRVPDLGAVFFGRLHDGGLSDIRAQRYDDARSSRTSARQAQVRFTIRSDDLVALVEGRLGFAGAWATGRVRVEANPRDLLRLHKLL